MKICLYTTFFIIPHFCFSQYDQASFTLLKKLDSIQHSSSISRHFGELYFKVTANTAEHFAHENEQVQDFMQRLEHRFADYFFTTAQLYNEKKEIPAAWKTYYIDTTRSSLQYFLLGANAHINGDIWQALTNGFSLSELKEYKKYYYRYNQKLKSFLLDIYDNAFELVSKVRIFHSFTLGLDKQYCKQMLIRWRKRQMKLSMLWFTDRNQFERKLTGLKKKMQQLDKLILHNL